MNYGVIHPESMVDGPGVRVSLFVSGCPHRCLGCFNEELWDQDAGQHFSYDTLIELLKLAKPRYIKGLSILGGEPLAPGNTVVVASICEEFKKAYPDKTIWLYTGYRWEDVKDLCAMKYVDVLVDGRFMEAEKDLTLRFRGSRNQRIIDVRKSENNVTLWEENDD